MEREPSVPVCDTAAFTSPLLLTEPPIITLTLTCHLRDMQVQVQVHLNLLVQIEMWCRYRCMLRCKCRCCYLIESPGTLTCSYVFALAPTLEKRGNDRRVEQRKANELGEVRGDKKREELKPRHVHQESFPSISPCGRHSFLQMSLSVKKSFKFGLFRFSWETIIHKNDKFYSFHTKQTSCHWFFYSA